jgi:hypothetical protein
MKMGKSMGLKKLLFVVFGVFCLNAFAFEEDPFIPMLPKEIPKKVVQTAALVEAAPVQETVTPPTLTVAGVLWGTDKPMAIINGNVYGVGAMIGESGAKIHKIEKNVVTIIYKMQTFDLTTSKKINKEER